MLLLGGGVRGGKVYGRWPGLARERLYGGRDLAVTTDFRALFSEVAGRHLGKQRAEVGRHREVAAPVETLAREPGPPAVDLAAAHAAAEQQHQIGRAACRGRG